MDIRKQFAKNLRECMEAKGVCQKDLMDGLGYKSSTVSQWCTGKMFPRPSKIEALAKYLEVSVDALYAGSSVTEDTKVITQEVVISQNSFAELKEAGSKRVIIEF
jgi:transcriptional regulator with XRE-family HTH domain